MNKKICVYTCITGEYDYLHEIENPEQNVDYICFTNIKNLKSDTWKIIQIKDDKLDNHYLSRKIKMLGDPIISKNYDISVWMDASIIWKEKISDFVSSFLKDAPFAAFKHSLRKSVHEEAKACLRFHKDTKEQIVDTLSFLEAEAFPDNLGLYEMTVFIKKHNDPIVKSTMQLWFDILQKYSKRDQLSFVYAVWKTGLKINPINLNVWDNSWFSASTHIKKNPLKECHVYYGDSSQEFDFEKYYSYKYKNTEQNIYSFNTIIPYDTDLIEIDPVDGAYIAYKIISIHPSPKKISSPDTINYNNNSVVYIEHDLFRIEGTFKKGQKISFSIYMKPLSCSELFQIAQQLKTNNNILKLKNSSLANENHQLNLTIQKIQTSRTWKVFSRIRKIFPFH